VVGGRRDNNRRPLSLERHVILSAAKNPGSLLQTLRTAEILRCAQNDSVFSWFQGATGGMAVCFEKV
jgi:hypothetical protein